MNDKIHADRLYWASGNYHEFRIPGEAVLDIAHSGDNAPAVAAWVDRVRDLADQNNFPNGPTPESIRRELGEMGAWDDEELTDDEQNWHRLLWCAAWDIAEQDALDHSEPLSTAK
jgi:hypothetical protein